MSHTAILADILTADYADPAHAAAITGLLDAYAQDPMGGGKPLSAHARECLVPELAARRNSLTLLAYLNAQPVGLVIAFEGFSTFACAPLLNLHDIVVLPEARGRGIARAMMAHAEAIARDRGCCKLTLEVLSGNQPARAAYENFGFRQYALDPAKGQALFFEKPL